MKIISKRGDADFASIAEAMAWADTQPEGELLFVLRMDAYDEPITIKRDHVRLIGEAQKRTIVNTDRNPIISGQDVQLEQLTVKVKDAQNEGKEPTELVYEADENRPKYCFALGDETMVWLKDKLHGREQTEFCILEGASAKIAVTSKWLGMLELCLHEGDQLIIQIGTHDSDADIACRTESRTTFTGYLSMMIDAARMKKAEPILIAADTLQQEYAAAMRDLAVFRGVRCIRQGENLE